MSKQKGKEKKKKRGPNRVVRFLRDVRAEIRRVIWPTPPETRNLTLVVIVLSAALGLIMWFFDLIFSRLYQLLTRVF